MKSRATSLQACDAVLVDVDGTVWHDAEKMIPGSVDFLQALYRKKIPTYLFTNITRYTRSSIVQLLAAHGATVQEERVITATISAVRYLKQREIKKIYAIGTGELCEEFSSHGFAISDTDAQAVMVGFDRTLNYEKLLTACTLVGRGAPLIAIHNEPVWRNTTAATPSIGATIAFIRAVTNVEPIVVGKPSALMGECAIALTGVPAQRTAIIGDRLDSDMRMAEEFGMVSVLVLSGHTTRNELATASYQPDYVVDSVANLIPLFS